MKRFKSFTKLLLPKVRLATNIANELVQILPGKDSTALQKVVGTVTAFDRIHTVVKGARDPAQEYVERFDLVAEQSEPFVSLFFDSGMSSGFDTRKIELTKYEEGFEATSDRGRLFFVMSNYSNGKPRPTFYRSKTFDIQAAVDQVWESREGRLAAEITSLDFGDTKTHYYSFPEPKTQMFGTAPKKLDALIKLHRRFEVDDIPRAYCFFGLPGTGKTSFADRFASALGERTLRIDASSFVTLTSRDIGFLVGVLRPDFLIIDDGDKTGGGSGVSRLLALLERFKDEHPKTTFIMTANTTSGFDPGFKRPGRISKWLKFELPEVEERLAILRSYLEDSKLRPTDDGILKIAEATEGLSQDYLRELAQLSERADLEEVLETVKMQKELLLDAGSNAPGTLEAAAPNPLSKYPMKGL